MSLTYLAVFFLTGLGVENADNTVNAVVTVGTAVFILFRRWQTGDLHWSGFRK